MTFTDESKGYLKQSKTVDQYFVETQAYQKGKEIFSKYGIVIWTGPPGCGKTQAAVHLILKQMNMKDKKSTFRRLSLPEELLYVEKNKETIILLDNIFFQQNMDSIKIWWDELRNFYKCHFESNGNESAVNRVRLVITARENLIERAGTFMGNITPVLNDNFRVNANILTGQEKKNIFFKQLSFAKEKRNIQNSGITADFLTAIQRSEGPIGFPLCAHLYLCSDKYKKSGVNFFSHPIDYLKRQIKDEINRGKNHRTKSLFLVLYFHEWQQKMGNPGILHINNSNECKELLENIATGLGRHFSPLDFEELELEAQRLVGAFLRVENDGTFTFVHDSVYEAVGGFLCETYVIQTARYFPLEIIQSQDYEQATKDQQADLVKRLLSEALAQNMSKVFACRLFHQSSFARCFLSEVEKLENKDVRRFFKQVNQSSPIKLPCLFWTSFYELTELTEQFYIIAFKKNIKPDYQLYSSLYGECCAGNECLLNTIDPWVDFNFDEIQRRVLSFGQKENMSILHLVVASERSDKFATDIVEKLLSEKMHVDLRSKPNKLTPLMSAVNHRQERTQVVLKLIEHSAKLTCKDWNDSNVFHHCIGSCNDDETCAGYLNILLRQKDANACLSQSNSYGNTPFLVAVMEKKYSRICSILSLLKHGSKSIITTINDDGCSPLQLCIRSLKGTSAYVELECCVRVMLLLLCGGSPENESDKNDIAIEECKFGPVQDILNYPKDERVMMNALDSILKKIKESNTISALTLTFPDEISLNIKSRIIQATKILKNVRIDEAI